MTTKTSTRRVCSSCNRKLKPEHYVYSPWVLHGNRWRWEDNRGAGSRYCWPGEGCNK